MADTGAVPLESEQYLRERVGDLGPFLHAIDLPHEVSTHDPSLGRRGLERTRVSNLVEHAWPTLLRPCGGSLQGKRVLDVACCSGGFTVEAVKAGADFVLGIDVVDHYIEQARFVQEALKLRNVDFRTMNMDDLSPETVGTFDVSFCFGILYHLESIIPSMQALASVTDRFMLVDTEVLRLYRGLAPFLCKRPLWYMNVAPAPGDHATTTNQWRRSEAAQFNPTPGAVIELLHFLGFQKVETIPRRRDDLERRYRKGTRMTFLAERT